MQHFHTSLQWRRRALCLAGLLALSSTVFAQGTGPEPASVQELAAYQGPDRAQRILEGARREGELNLYTSMDAVSSKKVKEAFEAKYGVKVNLWRSSSENVVQRSVAESKAGRFKFDVAETNGPDMEAIQREKLLQKVQSPYFPDLVPQALLPHGEWVATRLNVFVQGYNTNKVKKADLPKTFEDLLDPKWKGKLAIEMGDYDWFFTVVNNMGEEKGLKYFRGLVAKNGVSVRKGHALIGQMLVSGEVPFALTVYSFNVDQGKKIGAPVEVWPVGPLIVRPNGVGISRNAPHPHAAMLFYDYMLSDAQKLLNDIGLVPVSKKIDSPVLRGHEIQFVDPVVALDEAPKWQKLFDEIFMTKAK